MKHKTYSEEIWNRLQSALDFALAKDSEPVAAFDADGTLWNTDLGENFFHHQIQNKLVPLPPEPWTHYLELKKKNNDPSEAYLWLAQINRGRRLEEVRSWAEAAVQNLNPLPIFEDQKKLIELFLSKGVRVYVITASVKWSVEPGAKLLGLDADSVIGVETTVENDLVTDKQKGVITYQMGKVEALLEKTGGKKPFFASGNTMGDFHLLNSATNLALAVSAADPQETLFRTEEDLRNLAVQKSWMTHRFA